MAAEKARLRNNRIGTIGSRVRSSQATNAATRAAPNDHRRQHGDAGPAVGVAAHHAQTMPNRPALAEHQAGQVELALGP